MSFKLTEKWGDDPKKEALIFKLHGINTSIIKEFSFVKTDFAKYAKIHGKKGVVPTVDEIIDILKELKLLYINQIYSLQGKTGIITEYREGLELVLTQINSAIVLSMNGNLNWF